jgi:hypothetical protein
MIPFEKMKQDKFLNGHITYPIHMSILLTVDYRIKVRLDLQAEKSSVVAKGPFFPWVWTQGTESVEQCVMHDPI